jgi:protease-4
MFEPARNVVSQIEEAMRRRTAPLILELDLTEPLIEAAPQDPVFAFMARRRTTLRAALDGLRRAAEDPRVEAFVVKLGGSRSPLGVAQAQELRDAVLAFRERSRKPTIAWAETFGELGRGTVPYYLASGFDEIWLQPSGDLCLTGLAAEVPFLKGVLDKAGITPQMAQRHEYKNAANLFTEEGFTEAHREATERIVTSTLEQMVAGIAAGRRLDVDEVLDLIDRAPLFSSDAVEAGLVDRLGYRDEVIADIRRRTGDGEHEPVLLFIGRYGPSRLEAVKRKVSRAAGGDGDRDVVALVHVHGPIHLGRSGRQPFAGGSAGSDSVGAAIRAAAKADDVTAVVLRVTSPGGSYVASDAIWREVVTARETGKPVVVSMGDVAASGGYFVAMEADRIVAEPGTITGSIGVVAGKQVVEGLAERIGLNHDHVVEGDHALMFSPFNPFSDSEWERLNDWLDRIYADFTAKVARGRRLPVERVHEIARGRVWTGADAKDRGLVDELGGLDHAINVARDRAGLEPTDRPTTRTYPHVPMVARLRPPQSSEDPAAASVRLGLEAWGGFAGVATRLGLPAAGPLTLPGGWRLG